VSFETRLMPSGETRLMPSGETRLPFSGWEPESPLPALGVSSIAASSASSGRAMSVICVAPVVT